MKWKKGKMSRNMEDQSLQPKGGKQRGHVLHLKAYSKSWVGKEGCQEGDNSTIENNNLTTLGRPDVWKQKSGKRSHWDPCLPAILRKLGLPSKLL